MQENLRGGKFCSTARHYFLLIARFRRRWQHGSTHARLIKQQFCFTDGSIGTPFNLELAPTYPA